MNALIAKLGSDAALLVLMPNGVHEELGPEGVTRFVVVSQVVHEDVDGFEERAIEDAEYMVLAKALGGDTGDAAAAADVIDALLAPQPPLPPATLVVPGYHLMVITREEFIRAKERDEKDVSMIWKIRGGRYRVMMSL